MLINSGLINFFLLFKENNKVKKHTDGNVGRHKPYLLPLMDIINGIVIGYKTGKVRADKHAGAIRGKSEKSLCGILDFFTRLLFGIHVSGNEKEIITYSMKNNAGIQHPQVDIKVAKSKADVTE